MYCAWLVKISSKKVILPLLFLIIDCDCISAVDSYELKDTACHDVIEGAVDLYLKWFADQKGMGWVCQAFEGLGS